MTTTGRRNSRPRAKVDFSAGQASTARSVIIETAVHLFGKMGYTATSMRDIAKSVGLLPGSLYAHIDSKETLLVEIVEEGIASFLNAVEPIAASDADASERMREAIKAHVRTVAARPELSLVVFHQWRFLNGDKLEAAKAKRRRYEMAFIRILEDGIQKGVFAPGLNRRIAILSVLGALNWVPEWFSPDGPASADEVGDMMADALLAGLAARRGKGRRASRLKQGDVA